MFNWKLRTFEGKTYLSSDEGKVFTGSSWTYGCNHHGYKMHNFKYVHRIVASAWCPNSNNYNVVDHIDGNRSNNKPENLRWVTTQENAIAYRELKRLEAGLDQCIKNILNIVGDK